MINELNTSLEKEFYHWHLYTHAAFLTTGLHREEYKEFFLEEAKGEAEHIQQFSNLIIGLGGTPIKKFSFEMPIANEQEITNELLLQLALKMEEEVVQRYVHLMDRAEELEEYGGSNKIAGRYIHIFLEDQILDSRATVDNIKQILKNSF